MSQEEPTSAPFDALLIWSRDDALHEALCETIAQVVPDASTARMVAFEEVMARCAQGCVRSVFVDQRMLDAPMRQQIAAMHEAQGPLLPTCVLVGPSDAQASLAAEALELHAEGILLYDRLSAPLLRFVLERAERVRARDRLILEQAEALAMHNSRLRDEVERQNEALLEVNATLKAQIDQRDQLTVQLQTADRLASVGLLARGIAHTLNNPLAYVQSNLDMVVEELGVAEPDHGYIQECLDDVLHGVGRITRIVAIIGRLNPTGQHAQHPVDVRGTLESLLETIREEIWSRAAVELDVRDVSPVRAHEPGLAQIILNLILRASRVLKHHNGSGRALMRIVLDERDGHVVLSFEDSGPSLPDDAIKFLFDPFHELEPSTAELYMELPVVYQLVREFDGVVEARRGEPDGMIFEVRLPALAP